jgi:mRNA interferase RelE/StbE
MTWIVNLDSRAAKTLKAIDKPTKQRIESFINQLTLTANPRATGKALQGQLADYWCYRIGDYRLICHIKDGELIILVIKFGHRKDVYE